MTRRFKSFMFEFALYVLGYIAYIVLKALGRVTMHLGRTVFSR